MRRPAKSHDGGDVGFWHVCTIVALFWPKATKASKKPSHARCNIFWRYDGSKGFLVASWLLGAPHCRAACVGRSARPAPRCRSAHLHIHLWRAQLHAACARAPMFARGPPPPLAEKSNPSPTFRFPLDFALAVCLSRKKAPWRFPHRPCVCPATMLGFGLEVGMRQPATFTIDLGLLGWLRGHSERTGASMSRVVESALVGYRREVDAGYLAAEVRLESALAEVELASREFAEVSRG